MRKAPFAAAAAAAVLSAAAHAFFPAAARADGMELRAIGVPSGEMQGVEGEASLRILEAFKARHPGVKLLPATGISMPGPGAETQPLMQIAGDIAPDAMYVNFRMSDTYVRNKFLAPLDRHLERQAGLDDSATADAHLLADRQYLELLASGPIGDEIRERLPPPIWEVIRRECPYGENCAALREWGRKPAASHFHVWAMPYRQVVMALFYRRDVFAEAGLPDRVPETYEELRDWARRTTNPADRTWGLALPTAETGWSTLSFLYSWGGRAVKRGEDGAWRCAFDSPEAADAYSFVARLYLEPFTNSWGALRTCVDTGEANQPGQRCAMYFKYLDERAFDQIDPNLVGFGPVPRGPGGLRGSEYNCMMLGVWAGTAETDPAKFDLAWDWIWFSGGREASAIHARTYVENGLARFVRPSALRAAGFEDEARLSPPGWEEAYESALEGGVPEPYGRNCQLVYSYLSRAIDQIRNDREVRAAVLAGDAAALKARVSELLAARVVLADEKMIGRVPENVMRMRRRVAACAAVAMAVAFFLVFRRVFRAFAAAIP
ncbi:MAG: extracellular solute-binding protein, partial [Kiritimatiellae bacterium]|nr:extracellular solute-binding protein [Kiritimatiellia bacterium]